MSVSNTIYIPQSTLRMYLRTHYEYICTSEHTRWLYLTQCIYLRIHNICISEHTTYAPQNTLGKRSYDLGKKATRVVTQLATTDHHHHHLHPPFRLPSSSPLRSSSSLTQHSNPTPGLLLRNSLKRACFKRLGQTSARHDMKQQKARKTT